MCATCGDQVDVYIDDCGSCGGCSSCGTCSCGEHRKCDDPITNLVDGKHIKTNKLTTNECGSVFEINNTYEVTEDDGSVVVTPTAKGVKLKAKVATDTYQTKVDSGSCPGFLQDLLVQGNNITLTPVTVAGCKKLSIASTAQGTDSKVATSAGCTPNTLDNLLETSSPDLFSVTFNGCKVQLSIKDIFKKPIARRGLTSETSFSMSPMGNSGTPAGTLPPTGAGPYSVDPTYGWFVLGAMDMNDNLSNAMNGGINPIFVPSALDGAAIKVPKTGRYRANMHWNCKYNRGVDSVNMQMFTNGGEILMISDEGENNVALMKASETWYSSTSHRQQWGNASKTVFLQANTLVYMGGRFSTDVRGPNELGAGKEGIVTFRDTFYKFGAGLNTAVTTAIPDGGKNANYFELEWLTDSNGNTYYI